MQVMTILKVLLGRISPLCFQPERYAKYIQTKKDCYLISIDNLIHSPNQKAFIIFLGNKSSVETNMLLLSSKVTLGYNDFIT